MKVRIPVFAIGLLLSSGLLVACADSNAQVAAPVLNALHHRNSGSSPIQHVIMVVQENRSFDNLFATFPGANGATRGKERVKKGKEYVDKFVTLKPSPLVVNFDIAHCHSSFETAYHGGKMDGFNLEPGVCNARGKTAGTKPYQYVDPSQIQPYWDMAEQWVLADNMFQTQASGSFTAHQDLIRGGTCITSTASCNSPSSSTESLVDTPTSMPWGCDAPNGTTTKLINDVGQVQSGGPFPCTNEFPNYGSDGYVTLADRLDAAGISWKYYTPCFKQSGCAPSKGCPDCDGALLNAFDVVYSVRHSSEWGTNVSEPDTNIFTDVSNNALPAVSWVIPEDGYDDHPKEPTDTGPQWVASIVNAIGESSYWNSSAIIVLWDDWGGFYDHVSPPFQDGYGGLGFRIPMIVISPYAIAGSGSNGGYIAGTQYETDSILRFIEANWNLDATGPIDARATSIGNIFNYRQSPRSFTPIPSSKKAEYFLRLSHSPQRGDPE